MSASSSQRPQYWPQSVQIALDKIKPGDFITVTWIDASRSIGPFKKTLPNHNVETRAVSEGRFYGIQKGVTYHDYHLIILQQTVDGRKITVESIPLVLVKSISTDAKTNLQFVKEVDRRSIIRFRDGSVKIR